MKQFFLKFADEQEAKDVLAAYVTNEQHDDTPLGIWITGSKVHALDVVGVISEPTGETVIDAEGFEYPEMAPIEGFHINIMINNLPVEVAPYAIYPSTPSRIFAGGKNA